MIEYYVLVFTGICIAVGVIGKTVLVFGKGKDKKDAVSQMKERINDPDVIYKYMGDGNERERL